MMRPIFSKCRLPWATAWLVLVLVIAGTAFAVVTSALPYGGGQFEAAAKKKKSLPPYTVRETGPGAANQLSSASASCDDGDRATGGGFEGVDFGTTRIVDSSPFNSIDNAAVVDSWTVDYTNGANSDSVTAIVVCSDRKPQHS